MSTSAPFFLTQRLCEPMVKQGSGSICNLASIHGLQGAPEHSVYAATKGAIIACTRVLAVELGYRGIRVNAIAPGWISVEGHATAIPGFSLKQAVEDARNKVRLLISEFLSMSPNSPHFFALTTPGS